MKKTRIMWRTTATIIRFAAQRWTDRIHQPSGTSPLIARTDSHAPSAVGR